MKRTAKALVRALARNRAAALASTSALTMAWAATAATPPKPRPGKTAASVAAPAAGNPDAGRLKAEAERCNECHGTQGQGDGHSGNPEVRFPKLAGQHADYLVRQLQHYRSGQRRHDVMRLNTQRLDDEDLLDLAAFYAALPPMHREGNSAGGPAAALFEQGDAARGIPACAGCHGSAGRGTPVAQPGIPLLAGQDARYLEQQLLDWRSAWRTEPGGGVMNQITRSLGEAEIRALAGYLASQGTAP